MEHDYIKIVNSLKELIITTNQASVMSDIEIGEVIQINPLIIQTESKVPIHDDSIILTKNTSLWSVDMDVNHHTENTSGGGGYAEFASHNHEYKGRKTYRVHNELQVGDKVILLRESGGQRYIALDKYYNTDRGCND